MNFSRNTLSALFVVLVLAFTATTLAFSAAEIEQPRHPLARLVELGQSYAELDSLHLKTEIYLTGTDGNGEPFAGGGTYELWRSGTAYRVHSYSDPSLGLQEDLEIVFDGTSAYYFMPGLSLVEIRSGDYGHRPTALPNPMTLAFSFLPDKPGCDGCRLELSDLKKDGVWRDFLSRTKIDIGKSGPSKIQFTEHSESAIRLTTVDFAKIGGLEAPTRIVHGVGPQIFEFEFSDFVVLKTDRSNAPVPKTVRFEVGRIGKDQEERVQAHFNVTTLTTKVDRSIFEFDLDRADRIWDRSLDMFIN